MTKKALFFVILAFSFIFSFSLVKVKKPNKCRDPEYSFIREKLAGASSCYFSLFEIFLNNSSFRHCSGTCCQNKSGRKNLPVELMVKGVNNLSASVKAASLDGKSAFYEDLSGHFGARRITKTFSARDLNYKYFITKMSDYVNFRSALNITMQFETALELILKVPEFMVMNTGVGINMEPAEFNPVLLAFS